MPLTGGFASFRRIVLSATIAGLAVGALTTAIEITTVVPLILQAEEYEQSESAGTLYVVGHEHGAHDHGVAHDQLAADEHEAESPEGMQRTLYTAIVTMLVAIAYGLMLGACFAQMRSVGWRKGGALGVAGFLVFQLAPALGLPPVPPGVPGADIVASQLWWLGTVLATALGFASLYVARWRKVNYWWGIGFLLIALPHLIGAPQPELSVSPVPEALARNFAVASVLVAAFFWVLLGGVQGYIFERLGRQL